MKVDGQRLLWREGKTLVFDDTYEHEVWNQTAEERVVLLLHVKRPVRFPGSLVSSFFLSVVRASPFIQDALKNLEEWNSRVRA
jgi:beta-hydroxylase